MKKELREKTTALTTQVRGPKLASVNNSEKRKRLGVNLTKMKRPRIS